MQDSSFDAEITSLLTTIGLLTRRVRGAVVSHDLSLAQTLVLARLAKDGPATAADLARAEGMKPQSMATIVVSLEGRGLIERTPHPTDGRQRQVGLTAQGVTVRKTASEEKRTWLAQAIGKLDEKDQQTLFAAGAILLRLVEA